MNLNFYSKLALGLAATAMLAGCGEGSQKAAAQPYAPQDAVTKTSPLHQRLPASCFVNDSDNLPFCMPGDTLIYEPNPKKEQQATVNQVIGGFCNAKNPIVVNGSSVICSFRQNRTYNATPINQQAIVASNLQTGDDYLAQVARQPGIKNLAPGIYVLYLQQAPKDAPAVNNEVAVQVQTKLLSPSLEVHSYMLDDLLTLDSLAQGNPFALVFPTLKKGDVVRVYINYRNYPGVWNVDSSLHGLPYIWEVNVLDVKDKAVVAEQRRQALLREQQLRQQAASAQTAPAAEGNNAKGK